MTRSDCDARPWWRALTTLALAATLTLGLGGCELFDDDDDDDEDVVEIGESLVRFVHAVDDAPEVTVNVDGAPVFAGIPFKGGASFVAVDANPVEVSVEALTAGGDVTVLGPQTLNLVEDTEITVIAVGSVAADTIDAVVIENPEAPFSGVRAQVVHAAPDAPEVDVYVTAPGADLTAEAPLATFSFGEFTDQVEVPAGDYQIRVTPNNDPATVVFDSGTVTLPDGADLTILAVNSTLTGDAPISLVVLDASGLVPDFEIPDVDTPAAVRVVHASPDAPAVDVVVNDDFANPAVNDLPFPQATGFLPIAIPAGDDETTINVKVTPFDNPGTIVNDPGDDLTLARGVEYTVIATGFLADFQLLPLADDDRPVATDARVRLVHGSPSAGNVDIYVTAQGADIANEVPVLSDVPFRASTDYLAVAPGDYDITITPTGQTTAAIGPLPVTLAGGGVYTAIARDAEGGGTPLNVILLDDFVVVQ